MPEPAQPLAGAHRGVHQRNRCEPWISRLGRSLRRLEAPSEAIWVCLNWGPLPLYKSKKDTLQPHMTRTSKNLIGLSFWVVRTKKKQGKRLEAVLGISEACEIAQRAREHRFLKLPRGSANAGLSTGPSKVHLEKCVFGQFPRGLKEGGLVY